jgi:anti-sigma factor RsiW
MYDPRMGDAPPTTNGPELQGAAPVPEAVLEEYYWMMSLALDGLLDEGDRVRFEAHAAEYPSLAALWDEWQRLDTQLDAIPHAEPAPGFVERFELRLAQQEHLQQQRVLALSLVAALLVAVGAITAMLGTGAYILSAHGAWLGEQLQNAVYLSVAADSWINALVDSLAALANTPQAQALGFMYVVVAIVMIFGWVQLLRRSARLTTAMALGGME